MVLSFRTYLTILLLFIQVPVWAVEPVQITIDPTVSYQTISGWGGHVYPQAYPYFKRDDFKERMLDELKTTHIRIRSVWYELEDRNDNDDATNIDWQAIAKGDTGLVHDEFLMLQLLFKQNVKLMFAAWRFPYWMIGQPPDWRPSSDQKTPLPAEMDAEFVESIVAYLIYAREKYGIIFHSVSVANEPDAGIYIKGLDPARLLRIALQLKQRLLQDKYETLYYLPDVSAADSKGKEYTEAFFQLEKAAELSASVSYHSYRRDLSVIRYFGELGEKLGLPVWVTEQNDTHLSASDRFDWSHGMKNAICLFDILVHGNASLSIHFSYAMPSSDGIGIYLPEKNEWSPTYSILKHFYNFLPPGAVRIRVEPASSHDDLYTLAFKMPSIDRIIVIVINHSDREQLLRFKLKKMDAKIIRTVLSNEQEQFQDWPINDLKNLSLSAQGLATMVFE